jgi:hypothetical protein
MSASIDPEWKRLFDFCAVACHKPLFQKTDTPFYYLDESTTRRGMKITCAEELHEANYDFKVFVHGNAMMLTEYLRLAQNVDMARVAYFGSHYLNDCQDFCAFNTAKLFSKEPIAKWHVIGVLNDCHFVYDSAPADLTS